MKVPYISIETDNYRIEGVAVLGKNGGLLGLMLDAETYLQIAEMAKEKDNARNDRIDEFVWKEFLKW